MLNAVGPILLVAGQAYIDKDDNDTGADDATGQVLVWLPNLINALVRDKPLPVAPKALQPK